jgi:5-methylcytosine-specific restriction enzyme A
LTNYFYEMDESVIKREKAKARDLRQSRWWQNRIQSNAVCYYCQKKLRKDEVTMDHLLPLVRGGLTSKSNVVMACKPCNNAKKDQLSWDFKVESLPPHTET